MMMNYIVKLRTFNIAGSSLGDLIAPNQEMVYRLTDLVHYYHCLGITVHISLLTSVIVY